MSIAINLPCSQEPAIKPDYSKLANIPAVTPSNMLLNNLSKYFENTDSEFDSIDNIIKDLSTLSSAERYIFMHGINRVTETSYGPGLESIGVVLHPEDYKVTLQEISDKEGYIKDNIKTSLEAIAVAGQDSNVTESWDNVSSYLGKKAMVAYSNAAKASYELDVNKKVIGVTPSTFETHAKHVVTIASALNNSSTFDLSQPMTLQLERAVVALENAEYKFDTISDLSWSMDDVHRLGNFVKNYIIPTTLRFSSLVAKLKQGCHDVLKDYDTNKYEHLKQYHNAIKQASEITVRLLTQYTDMI